MKPASARAWLRRWPWGISALLGLALAIVGMVITFRPFTSLSVLVLLVAGALVVTGVATLSAAETWWPRLAGIGWIAVGILALAWPLIPELIQWTRDRIAGRPATSTCRRPDRPAASDSRRSLTGPRPVAAARAR